MTRVIVSLLAQADTAYIAADLKDTAGCRVAARYLSDFEAVYDRLTLYPDSGPRRPVVGANVRIGVVSPYIIIYEHDRGSDVAVILRIVHGKQKITGKSLLGH